MWKFVLPPVLMIISFWVFVSTSTTFYVFWIGESYERVLEDHVGSIDSANDLLQTVRRVQGLWPTEGEELNSVTSTWHKALNDLSQYEQTLQELSTGNEERLLMERISGEIGRIRELSENIDSEEPSEDVREIPWQSIKREINRISDQIDSQTTEFKSIKRQLIDKAAQHRDYIGRVVLTSRLAILFTGPLLGIWLGWRLSKQLQSSVARIAVTLTQADQSDVTLGTVTLHSNELLGNIQQQAEQIIAHLKESHQNLEEARREVTRSERLAAVGQLAAGVAHELRNPLTSVKLLLQHQRSSSTELNTEKLQLILDEVDRMERTIQGLLDFSRQRPLQRYPHDIRETLRRATNLVDGRLRQHDIQLCENVAEEPLLVDGDAELLNQVFANLFINAVEAMPHSGTLSIKVEREAESNCVRIAVADTGSGIPVELMPRIFEPFATNKERGTGLGLAVSRRIVDQHQGLLTASNRAEGGAEFVVELPLLPVFPVESGHEIAAGKYGESTWNRYL